MIWFLIWLLFAAAIFGFMGWSTNILLAQKKAWATFGGKYKLTVTRAGFFDPVAVNGDLQGRSISIYAQSETTETRRTRTLFSHIEIGLRAPIPAFLLLASQDLPIEFSDITLPERLVFEGAGPKPRVAQTDDMGVATAWLTPKRLSALQGFFKLDATASAIIVCDKSQMFMLFRTPDPLRDPRALNALIQKMYGFAKDLDGDAVYNTAIQLPKAGSDVTPDDNAADSGTETA